MGLETARLADTLSSLGQGNNVEFRPGTVRLTTAQVSGGAQSWFVQCGGKTVDATWNNDLSPWDGAPCVLALITVEKKTTFHVIYIAAAHPQAAGVGTVTGFTAGQPTCTVSLYGNSYTVQRASSYTPTVGDTVVVQTIAGQMYVFAPLTVYTPPPPPTPPAPPPPPAAATTGTSTIPAGDSATWSNGYNWNSYYGQDVFQGNQYVPMSSGYWFYNGGTSGLASKTSITAIRFWCPPRKQAGSYNNTLNAHFYAHTSSYRPGGQPTNVVGPFDIAIPPYFGGGWVNLPLSFAATLQGGGGISIAGDPYMGFVGVGGNGNSGALSVDWSM